MITSLVCEVVWFQVWAIKDLGFRRSVSENKLGADCFIA